MHKASRAYLSTESQVSTQLFLAAKHLIESGAIIFFDFFRESCFGYIQTGENRGYYTLVHTHGKILKTVVCRCHEAQGGSRCAHGLALFLKFRNWPNTAEDLSKSFDDFFLHSFFQAAGKKLFKARFEREGNPSLNLSEDAVDARFLEYLKLTDGELSSKAERDNKLLENTKKLARTPGELGMLRGGLPSSRVLYEESLFYRFSKLLFWLDRRNALGIHCNTVDDQVDVTFECGHKPFFQWRLPVSTFIKAIESNREFWREKSGFELQQRSMPLVYEIRFEVSGDLSIDPKVETGEDAFSSLEDLAVTGDSNLFFHPHLGYFRVQTGLSEFEMTYSNKAESIPFNDVPQWSKRFKDQLHQLDRRLFDQDVLGEVVIESFDRFLIHMEEEEKGVFKGRFEVQLGNTKMPLGDALKRLRSGQRYMELNGRWFDTRAADAAFLCNIWKTGDNANQLHTQDVFRLEGYFGDRLEVELDVPARQAYQQVQKLEPAPPTDLSKTKLDLRPYQKLGLEWLTFLSKHSLGGLLCDQMGLGKTHQGMALVVHQLKQHPKSPVLVIAPFSVIYHWEEKLARFCPDVKAVIYHGTKRQEVLRQKFHVILTTYGTIRNDVDLFKGTTFSLILYDEIQNLRNKATISHQQITQLQAMCRIGLTGTPIENKLEDLKALFDIVMPGYLGPDSLFQSIYVQPIVSYGSERAKQRLLATTNPFTLRRSKSEVVLDLPPKIEDIKHFELRGYELELYHEIRKSGRKKVETIDGKGSRVMHLFEILRKLKQVCNHPSLALGSRDYTAYPSTKWSLFTQMLTEALDGGEKVVVFSQFLPMLDLIAKFLVDLGVGFALMTGQTKDRREPQQRFQNNPDCRVFLGSLMASGVGIDLTAGTTLFHYDRWWNPAREEQASDRIHRIGQKEAVQIYRFTALNSIEERIEDIIERKRALLSEMVTTDEADVRKIFEYDQLMDILGE